MNPVLPEVTMGTRKLAYVNGGTTYHVSSYACRQIMGAIIVALTNTSNLFKLAPIIPPTFLRKSQG